MVYNTHIHVYNIHYIIYLYTYVFYASAVRTNPIDFQRCTSAPVFIFVTVCLYIYNTFIVLLLYYYMHERALLYNNTRKCRTLTARENHDAAKKIVQWFICNTAHIYRRPLRSCECCNRYRTYYGQARMNDTISVVLLPVRTN